MTTDTAQQIARALIKASDAHGWEGNSFSPAWLHNEEFCDIKPMHIGLLASRDIDAIRQCVDRPWASQLTYHNRRFTLTER